MTTFRSSLSNVSRRSFVFGVVGLTGFVLAGCSVAEEDERKGREKRTAGDGRAFEPAAVLAMTVYRDPSCGCCENWAEIARKAGYQVNLQDDPDMAAVKRRLGVPAALASCHTAQVGNVVIEGHVPLEDVARLLRESPNGIRGIAVPGMPAGSPGMEMPDGTKEPFQVIAFDGNGKSSIFRA